MGFVCDDIKINNYYVAVKNCNVSQTFAGNDHR